MAPSRDDTVQALLDGWGRTYADELGIKLGSGRPGELWRLLQTSIVFSTGLNHVLTLRAAQALRGLRTARAAAEAGMAEVRPRLDGAKVQRTGATSQQVVDAARECLERYGGDLRRLREEADGDVTRLDALRSACR